MRLAIPPALAYIFTQAAVRHGNADHFWLLTFVGYALEILFLGLPWRTQVAKTSGDPIPAINIRSGEEPTP